ncbi:serine/threonine-protein kinase [Botrimarina hoheduenensis]|uniref:non-specific serine/threonine protein kinase n=1 Tax=Botrimarina hoheduenensis TaxID=2528000 RepID=A0A5C5WEE5_9BACT|nr:serine/threonine-protein kinase [Botrimarina hoheduenensis]TWT48425.1 Serine/threonine-protein kinase StkP [Botrimarina hoheduenensis]
MNPERLGPYFIDSQIGKGGMGCVYRATHRDTGEIAAIKSLASNLAASEGFRDRFQSEIDSLRKLRHASIVRLLGHGEEAGQLFYAMELVDGPSLEQELRRGRRFTWREVTQIAIQISRALKHAHDHGVVHRDIKPANLLLTPRGDIKIADFGIARLFGSTGSTIAGGVLGTADYMSPEQAAGKPVTARCDQYALGCVMYTLLTGRTPFRADDVAAMLQMQRWAMPESVRRYAPETPVQLEQAMQQLLEKDPADRYPNTDVLARHLEAMLKAFARPKEDGFELAEAETPAAASSVLDAALDETRDAHAGDSLLEDQEEEEDALSLVEVHEDSGVIEPFTRAPSRYTVVPANEHQEDSGPMRGSLVAMLLWLGTLAAALTLFVWWWSRPPAADDLYESIQASRESVQAPGTAARSIERFLDLYPNDPRADEVREFGRTVELQQMRNRRALSLWIGERLGRAAQPEDLLYRSTMLQRERDPDGAAAALESLALLAESQAVDEGLEGQEEESQRLTALAELVRSEAEALRKNRLAELAQMFEYTRDRLAAARKRLHAGDAAGAAELAAAVSRVLPESDATAPLIEQAQQLVREAESLRAKPPASSSVPNEVQKPAAIPGPIKP